MKSIYTAAINELVTHIKKALLRPLGAFLQQLAQAPPVNLAREMDAVHLKLTKLSNTAMTKVNVNGGVYSLYHYIYSGIYRSSSSRAITIQFYRIFCISRFLSKIISEMQLSRFEELF